MTAQTPPNLPLPYNAPVRVLVHTVTGLVPKDLAWTDNVWDDKNTSMVNRISRYHWSGAYWLLKARRIRYYVYGCDYAYDDRRCYFLVDQGFTSNDEKVPILCWAWTGQDFKYTPSFLQRKKVQDTLKWYPFTRRHVYVRRNVRRKELSIRHQVGLLAEVFGAGEEGAEGETRGYGFVEDQEEGFV
ncbi:hypothetical protein N8T08_000070 [Aspergillus melleus]|uniref:Uncharacterized protein n=1 Tax=Aspergillus melleus TaxID=138277 RepID=A0ACC3BHG7_9EURO|nr:hypothetical protein N8T08_000070 [Aspergillus melleus]